MARLVHMAVVPHDPTLPAAAEGRVPNVSADTRRIVDDLERLRRNLAAARPDCILMIGNDHLCSFFMDNMPPFLIGKAPRIAGPPDYERQDWGLAAYDAPIEGRLARHLLAQGFEHDVDFAYSDEFTVDHALTIPLHFLRPQADLPVVPIFLNVMAPPVPPARRYRKVGQVVRDIVAAWDDPARVAVIATGHMTNGVGGPYMMRHMEQPESAWDRAVYERLVANDVDGVIARASWDEMYAQGNNTPGFLGYVFALGVAGGHAFSWHRYCPSTSQPLCLLLEWDEAALNGGRA